jgi:hypothetical protein
MSARRVTLGISQSDRKTDLALELPCGPVTGSALETFRPRPPMSSANRTKRYRARQRAGVAILKVPVPFYELVDALIEARRLTAAEALDRRKVEHAAGQALADLTVRWLQKV